MSVVPSGCSGGFVEGVMAFGNDVGIPVAVRVTSVLGVLVDGWTMIVVGSQDSESVIVAIAVALVNGLGVDVVVGVGVGVGVTEELVEMTMGDSTLELVEVSIVVVGWELVIGGTVVLRGTEKTLVDTVEGTELGTEVGTEVRESVDETVELGDTVGDVIVGRLLESVIVVLLLGTGVAIVVGTLTLPDPVDETVVDSVVFPIIDVGTETVDEPVPKIGGSDKRGVSELDAEAVGAAEAVDAAEAVGAVPGNDVVGKRERDVGRRVGSNPLSVLLALIPVEAAVPVLVLTPVPDSVALAVDAGRTALVTSPTALVTPPTTLVIPPISPPSELVEVGMLEDWVTTPVGAIRMPEEDDGTVVVLASIVDSVTGRALVSIVDDSFLDSAVVVGAAVVVPVNVPVEDVIAVLLAEEDVVSGGNRVGRSKLSVGNTISGGTPPVEPTLLLLLLLLLLPLLVPLVPVLLLLLLVLVDEPLDWV